MRSGDESPHSKRQKATFGRTLLDTNGIKVRFKDPDTQIRAKDVLQAKLGSDYTIALNLLSRSPDWLRSIGALPMYLGLDLRGGSHLLMEVDTRNLLKENNQDLADRISTVLREERLFHARPTIGTGTV